MITLGSISLAQRGWVEAGGADGLEVTVEDAGIDRKTGKIEALACEVEVDCADRGFEKATIVGLPDTAVKESLERVRAALNNSGYDWPRYKTVKDRLQLLLSPVDTRVLDEMKTARRVVAYNGIIASLGTYGWFIVFDDSSDSPYCALIQFALIERCASRTNVTFAVQTQQGVVCEFPCEIKAVPSIPPPQW